MEKQKTVWARTEARFSGGLCLTMSIGPGGFEHRWSPAWPGKLSEEDREHYLASVKRMRAQLLADARKLGKTLQVRP